MSKGDKICMIKRSVSGKTRKLEILKSIQPIKIPVYLKKHNGLLLYVDDILIIFQDL